MLPILSEKIFSQSQEVSWTVTVYNTPHTIVSEGIIYRPATPTSSFGDSIDFSTASLAAMNTHFDNNTTPGLVDSAGVEINGRIPVIYNYWGSEAPIGIYSAGNVALRFKGYIKTTGSYGFSVLGKGNAKVFVDSAAVLAGAVDEEYPLYTTSLGAYTAGDQVDIFYWGQNLEWGGIAVRVFSDAGVATSDGIDWDLMRETDILSASFMDSNVAVTSFTVPEATQVTITNVVGQISTCNIPIVLASTVDMLGWEFDHTYKTLVNKDTNDEIKRGNLVTVVGGYTNEQHYQFTGHIVDITPGEDTIELVLNSIEGRMTDQLSENLPDKLSYATFGYSERKGVENPVFGVPAYDHWPYEYALTDMLLRSWIDASLLNGKKELLRVDETTVEEGANLFRVRSLTDAHIRVQRKANYGNPYGDASLPPDDEYLTTSELTATLYARAVELTERIGYDFRADYQGNIITLPRNNPSSIVHVSSGTAGSVYTVNPAAIKGSYQKFTGTGWSYVASGIKASRIDLVTVRNSEYGSINVDIVRAEDSWSSSTTVDLDYADETFYYDQVLTVDLSNITSYSVLSGADYGTYTVTVTPNGGDSGTVYALNALRIFETDPETPTSRYNLSTLINAIKLAGRSNINEHVNDAIVTGARKAVLTDSQKVFDKIVLEYVVSRSTDTHAILNPSSLNYDGRKITAFLSDESIADQELADWTSRTLVSRYRAPEPSVSVTHTCIPTLELRDPVYVTDSKFDKYDATKEYWVTSFKTTYKPASALIEIELTPFAETPSYEPREEIDIALFHNKPIINLGITYPSLDGSNIITNPGLNQDIVSTKVISSGVIANDGTYYMTVDTGTVSPGTDLLYITSTDTQKAVNIGLADVEYFKNTPYHNFYEKTGTRLDLPFEMADGSAAYALNGWHVDTGDTAIFSFHKIQNPYPSGIVPFYDPYYSELPVPELISISFDALISGYYRVSIVDAKNSTPETIAWLTAPSIEDIEPEAHWSYVTAGINKTYTWDGVDNIGSWNRKQSEEYTWRQRGNFPIAENPAIGKGFYAQNNQNSALTHISDELDGSEVVYPIGKYAQFFIRVEVMRDISSEILRVESTKGSDNISAGEIADVLDIDAQPLTSRYIYYHLPQPNKATISIEDWDITAGEYDTSNPGNDWNSVPDNDATFRDTKPIKISITPVTRLGAKFTSNVSTYIKVHRTAHLSAQILDETAIISSEIWNSKSQGIYKKTLNTRRMSNDDHTLIFADNSFISGADVGDWTFYPSLFVKDFGRGEESIDYLNYLQLLEVPSWNPSRTTGEDRSRHLLAMIAYLFYLSVFTQDRSGRLVWAIDSSFVDKSKILGNTSTTTFPNDLDRHQRRTMYTRQWWDYERLDELLGSTGWNIAQKHYGGYSDKFDFHDEDAGGELYPLANTTSYVTGHTKTSYLDPYCEDLVDNGSLDFDGVGAGTLYRDLGNTGGSTSLGAWTWENDGFYWIPNITRDFHPFYAVPPMGRASYKLKNDDDTFWEDNYYLATPDANDESKYDNFASTLRVRTASSGEIASSLMRGGKVVEDEYKNTTVPSNIIQFQKQDDIKHYEDCRGAFTNGPEGALEPINIVGGNHYYLNTKLYRHFRTKRTSDRVNINYNDVWRKGWFFLTFRHTYNWESASMFPVDSHKMLITGALDSDKTGSPLSAGSFDPGGYAGWKDDHPSAQQTGTWAETGSAAELHWRNDHTNHSKMDHYISGLIGEAGGSNTIENPSVALTDEDKPNYLNVDQNIFLQRWVVTLNSARDGRFYAFGGLMPIAVGPRLPQTRRVLLALSLVNNRRTTRIS